MKKLKKYTYITLMTKEEFLPGVLILNESLRRVHSQYPLKCLITDNITEQTKKILSNANIEFIIVDKIELPSQILDYNNSINPLQTAGWADCLTKLHIFKFEQYDKIIFCDADLLFLKNCDHCFKMPHMTAALDGEYMNLWPKHPHFNSGFMVIKPSKDEFEKIMTFITDFKPEQAISYFMNPAQGVFADQELLNLFYGTWKLNIDLHLSKYYNVFPPHVININTKDILDNAYFVHFVGQKPWSSLEDLICFLETQQSVDPTFYIIAYSIFTLISDNHYYPLKWEDISKAKSLEKRIISIAVHEFSDVVTGQLFLSKINLEDKFYSDYDLKLKILKQVTDFRPVLKALINLDYYQQSIEKLESNLCTFSAQELLQIINTKFCTFKLSMHLYRLLLTILVAIHSDNNLLGLTPLSY